MRVTGHRSRWQVVNHKGRLPSGDIWLYCGPLPVASKAAKKALWLKNLFFVFQSDCQHELFEDVQEAVKLLTKKPIASLKFQHTHVLANFAGDSLDRR